ncbi:MAG: Ig-like domain-containing protein, partial [Chitinophagales bacterium]
QCDGQLVINLDPTQLGSSPYDVTYFISGVSTVVNNIALTGNTIVIPDLCAGSYYDISILDNGSCSTISLAGPFDISEPNELIYGGISDSTDLTACNVCDGTITLTGLIASTDYDVYYIFDGLNQLPVTITSGGTGELTLTGLCAGLYEDFVVVNSSTACTSTPIGSITLAEPTPEMLNAANVVVAEPTGCNMCDGSLTINGLTASTNYTVSYFFNGVPNGTTPVVTNVSGEFVLNNLCEGVYTDIIITNDVSGCESPAITGGPFNLTDPAAPTYDSTNVAVTNATSCGVCDGTLVISGLPVSTSVSVEYTLNGVGQSTYMNNTSGSGVLTIPGLCPGNYDDIEITDNVSTCTSNAIVGGNVISDPSSLTIGSVNITSQPTTCGICDGIITLSGGGMAASTSYDIEYTLNGLLQTTTLFTNAAIEIELNSLCAGQYDNFTVTDATLCTSPVFVGPFDLVEPNSPVIDSITTVDATNCGMCDGQLVIHLDAAQLGTAPYDVTYFIGGTSTTINNVTLTGNTIVIPDLCEGSYYDVSILDNGSCATITQAGPFVVGMPTILENVTVVTTNNPTLCNSCDGSIVIGGLPAGTYTVYYNTPAISVTGLVASPAGEISLVGLCDGTYTDIFVSNTTSGCNSLQLSGSPFILSEPAGPVLAFADVSYTDPTLCGVDDGTISISNLVDGNYYIVDYVVNNITTGTTNSIVAIGGSITFGNLGEANYSNFHLVDTTTGCQSNYAVGNFDMVYPNFTVSSVIGSDPSACGVCDGSITFTGVPPNATFQLNFDMNFAPQIPTTITSNAIGNAVFDNLCQDIYSNFELIDVSGCSSQAISDTITLTEPGGTIIDSIINITDPTTCNTCDGSFTITQVDNFTNYNVYYQLGSNPPTMINVTSTFTGDIIVANLCEGTYTNIVVEEASVSGCFSNILGPVTLVNPILNLGVLLTNDEDTICLGTNFNLEVQAFTPATTTIEWRYLDNDLNITPASPNMNPVLVTPTANRCYYAIMTDAATGCQDSDTVCVIVSGNPVLVADACFTLPEDSTITLSILNDVYANDNMNDVYGSGNLNDNLDISIITNVSNGVINIDETTDEIIYTPYANYDGTDTLFYSVCNNDCVSLCDSSFICFNVTSVNDAPIAVNDINNTIIGSAVVGNVLTNDDLTDGIGSIVSILQDGINGSVGTIGVSGIYTYIPTNATFIGEDSIVYSLCDNAGLCDTAVLYIEVLEHSLFQNNEPIANPDIIVIPFNGVDAITSNLLSNDLDSDGDNLAITQLSLATNGLVTIDALGNMAYTPYNANFVGDDSFEYFICDDGIPMYCDTTTVFITVTPIGNPLINHYPTAVDDANITYIDQAIIGNVSINDSDIDGDSLVFTLGNAPINGSVVLNADGTYTYTPNAGFEGADYFTYSVCDNGTSVLCTNATVYIVVVLDNLAPLAIDDINNTYIDIPTFGDVATNDFEPEGDALIFVLDTLSLTGGDLIFNNNGTYTFTPPVSAQGQFTFNYIVCDDGVPALCDTAEVVINVEDYDVTYGVNNDPVANDDNMLSTINIPLIIDYAANDFDVDGDSVFLTDIFNPEGLTLVLNSDSTLVAFIPAPGETGDFSFEYVICDNGNPVLCDTAEVTITIVPNSVDNQAPFAVDDANGTIINTSVTGIIWDNDFLPADGDDHNITITTQPTNGTVVLNADSTYTYTPDTDYYGPDQFTYVLCDNGTPVECDTATVYILVYNSNHAPVAVNDVNTTFNDLEVSGSVATNDFDIDNDVLTFTLLDDVLEGELIFNLDGSYTYIPFPGFVGTDVFTYIVCDDDNPVLCDTATVTIDVSTYDPDGNNTPVALDDNVVISGDEISPSTVVINLLSNDFQPDGNSLVVTIDTSIGPNNGSIVINPDGTVSYIPNPGFVGEDMFTYTICDELGNCDEATVTITVLEPAVIVSVFAVDDAYVTNQDTDTETEYVDLNDIYPTGSSLTATLINDPVNGTISFNDDGTFVYTPNTGFAGVDQFTYILCDNFGNCDEATVIITVLPDDVEAVDDFIPIVNNGTYEINILDNDTFTTGTPVVYILDEPINGTISLNEDGTLTYIPDSEELLPDSFSYVLCVNTICDTAWIYVKGPDLLMVTGISPNNDGVNDNFVIEDLLIFYPNAELNIFNRWGDEVWRSNGPYQNNWSGLNMEGKNLADGTYFVILDYNDGIKKPYSGFVVLYRNK